MGLYSLTLSCGIAVDLVLAGAADDLGGVQALFLLSGHSFLDLPQQVHICYTRRANSEVLGSMQQQGPKDALE
jgi:hypothetical protein